MTAEEYLNEHCKPEDWSNLEDCLKDSILTNNVIEHMEQYAALCIQAVVGQSEPHSCKYVRRVGESCTLNNNCKYPNCE